MRRHITLAVMALTTLEVLLGDWRRHASRKKLQK
jgi:hypothetical protein